jgi:Holliday junction resolvase RusA-like endonuclease
MDSVRFTILGECASKANKRRIVMFGDRPALIKSDKARGYERDALRQIPADARLRLTGPVRVTLRIFYASERPDLDESVVLDVLQDRYSREKKDKLTGIVYKPRELVQAGVYRNDRQVREKHVFHAIDRAQPRCEVEVEAVQAQQTALDLDEVCDADALPF